MAGCGCNTAPTPRIHTPRPHPAPTSLRPHRAHRVHIPHAHPRAHVPAPTHCVHTSSAGFSTDAMK
eukprot:356965-Chlamydomonas_euryale.AAC.2